VRRAVVIVLAATMTASGFAYADDTGPRFDFVLNCSGCHGLDARGSATVPSLVGSGALLATREGRNYLIRVPGVAQAPLSDDRLAKLMNWMLVEVAGAPALEPFTADEVAQLRKEPLRDPVRARDALTAK
jgi:hypothetical protein